MLSSTIVRNDKIGKNVDNGVAMEEDDYECGDVHVDPTEMDRVKRDYEREMALIDIWQKQEMERVEADFKAEEQALEVEYTQRLNELVEGLCAECEEKKRQLESEINSLDINSTGPLLSSCTGSSSYYNPFPSKKTLRRRANEPAAGEKEMGIEGGSGKRGGQTRRNSPHSLIHLLPETEIAEDLRVICGVGGRLGSSGPIYRTASSGVGGGGGSRTAVSVDANRLVYDGKTYHRGQNVSVETLNYGKFPASIQQLSEKFVQFRSTLSGDTRQVMATRDDLESGRVIVRKRY